MPSQSTYPLQYSGPNQANIVGRGSKPTVPYQVPSATTDHTSFVSGGSRPTAPIKTAIIRPTNYYDGSRRASIGSPDCKVKNSQDKTEQIGSHSPLACGSTMCPLTPDAESDPLSDNGAVMYGTNATRRRKSKVEAWMESSSSAQSEESLIERRGLSVQRTRRKPSLHISSNSSTLSKEQIDLSFEDLCEELLALSASCNTLERMLGNPSHHINGSHCSQAPAAPAKLISPNQTRNIGAETSAGSNLVIMGRRGSAPLSNSNSQQTFQSNLLSCSKDNSKSILLPSKKMSALTVDVGGVSSRYQPAANIPIEGTLVTITSARPIKDEAINNKQQMVSRRITSGMPVSESNMASFNGSNMAAKEEMRYMSHSTGLARPSETNSSISSSRNSSCTSRDPTDHVAAAIITQPVTSISTRSQSTTPVIHRSVSEPASFLSLPPDKRESLARTPGKREVKGRQLLRVGMDFIRHRRASPPTTGAKYPSKDNMLMNNLDICSQSKVGGSHPNKFSVFNAAGTNLFTQSQTKLVKQRLGSDSVFEDTGAESLNSFPPAFSSTCKPVAVSQSNTPTQTADRTKTTNESLSSTSFESEALDILASLKSANALKAQLRHGKFPTDVDPVTGSPRAPPFSLANEEKLRLMEGLNYPNRHQNGASSSKSSCLSSPSGSIPSALHHSVLYRSPAHCQTPLSRRSRQSYYDNVLQSPFGGLRISVASGSSSGTVFSKPWGDLPRLDDYVNHNDEFRHRVGSMVSSQGRSTESGGALPSPARHSSHKHYGAFRFERSRSTSCSHSGSDEQNSYHNLASIPRFPVTTLPDVTLDADMNRQKSSWEIALDRALSRVRTFTKLVQSTEGHSCEITRYTQTLLSDSHSLPGTLIGRFHTCTWETNSLDRSTSKQSTAQTAKAGCGQTTKMDWYSNSTLSNGFHEKNRKGPAALAYANGGYVVNQNYMSERESSEVVSSLVAKEHIVLSNVRQFMDGMKRYLLNRPDTQMMFAIQRERIKLGTNELINLDAIMEAVLERVILQPLSDHLLNAITTHPDYSMKEITVIENGMKAIVQHRAELFANLQTALSEIDSYEQTLRLVFHSLKSEFSPMLKLQYLLQIALLFLLIHNRSAGRDQGLQMLFIYSMARYGDASLIVHLAYIRHLIPSSMKGGATSYVLSLFETTVQVYSRIVKVPGALARRMMILNEILEKLSCHLMIADESTNRVIRKKISLSRWSTTSELIEIIRIDLVNHELSGFRLYLTTDDKDILLKGSDNVREHLMSECRNDSVFALVYRRPNTQMLLPPL